MVHTYANVPYYSIVNPYKSIHSNVFFEAMQLERSAFLLGRAERARQEGNCESAGVEMRMYRTRTQIS